MRPATAVKAARWTVLIVSSLIWACGAYLLGGYGWRLLLGVVLVQWADNISRSYRRAE